MSWGTMFDTTIEINKKVFENKYQVLSEIDSVKQDITNAETMLKLYAVGNIKDIIPKDIDTDPIYWINSEISSILEEYYVNIITLFKLELYLETFDTPSIIIPDE